MAEAHPRLRKTVLTKLALAVPGARWTPAQSVTAFSVKPGVDGFHSVRLFWGEPGWLRKAANQEKLYRSLVSWFTRGLRRLKRCLQNDLPLPAFHTPGVTDR